MKQNKNFKKLMIFSIATTMCLAVLVSVPTVSAATIYVPADYSTIQEAVNAANPGDTIIVASGTYNEMISINKPLTLLGANAGIHPTVGAHPTEVVGTRDQETILSHNGLYAISPSADDITIDGFMFTGTGGRIIDTYADSNSFSLLNCIFDNPDDHGATGNIQFGGGSHNNLLFAYNIFIDAGWHTFYAGGGPYDGMHIIGNKFNGYGEAIFWAASPLVDAVVEYNEFNGIYDGVPGDGGAYMNIGQGGNIIIRDNWFHDLFYTGSQVGIIDGELTDNIFENIYSYPGYWGTCFELWGGQYDTAISNNVLIEGNDFSYNEISGAAEPTHGLRLRAPEAGSGIDGYTIHVHDNNFYDGDMRTDAFAIWHQADGTVDAECNWWSDITGPYDPILNPGGLGSDLSGNVDFICWLDDIYPIGDCVVGCCNPEVSINPGYDPDANCTDGAGARWRNFVLNGNGWELAVGDPSTIATYNPGWANLDFYYSGDYYFTPDGSNTFTFTYDAVSGNQTIEADVNDSLFTKTQNNGNLGSLNYLQLDVVGRNGQTVQFNDVVLTVDGTDYNLCDFEAGGWLSWYIDSLDLTNGFSITGEVFLIGQSTCQECSKINICAGSSGCTPICKNVEDNIEYCTIQEAIDASTTDDGETIEVYGGTFIENAAGYCDINLNKDVSIIGQGSGNTIIELTEGKSEGLQITGINPNDITIEGITFTYQSGSTNAAQRAIRVFSDLNNLTLRDVVVEYAEVNNVEINGDVGILTIEDCMLHYAGVNGLICPGNITSGSITDSHFDYNGRLDVWASGMHLFGFTSNLDIIGCTMSYNTDSGFNGRQLSNVYFEDCTASYNTQPDGGGGICISEKTGTSSDIILINITAEYNGRDGILVWTWYDYCSISDVTVTGGLFTNNGWAGIRVLNWPATGSIGGTVNNVEIAEADILNNPFTGIWFELAYGSSDATSSQVNYNNIVDFETYGVLNSGDGMLNATCNWWGNITGPYHSSNPGGYGCNVSNDVIYLPWLNDIYPVGDCNGGIVGADIEQPIQDRGLPIRHAIDGDWGAAQNFTPNRDVITSVDIYLRKFGAPEFDLVVELRKNSPTGFLLDTITIPIASVPSSWTWFGLDFEDAVVSPGTDYFIVCPPAPSGVTNSYGYEWGYAFGDQYQPGSFWFTRDGGGLWRDLPDMYEFTFKTYGYG